ncbi:MAG: hypothetical protein WBA97_29155 [Actinophytocola sp.]|uniref:hypothetical protein n=1 Tax=Actinophytocola sp. TaxID=1872138 RepID=UPI003C742D3D
MTNRQELDGLLAATLDRHVAAQPALVADFSAVFGAGADETAAQWITYYVTQYADDIAGLTADEDATVNTAPAAPVPVDPAVAELLTDVRSIVDDAVAAVPEAALLSPEEIDQILMEVLGEDAE